MYKATHFICMYSLINMCIFSDKYLNRVKGVLYYIRLKINEIHKNVGVCPALVYTH